MGADLRRRISLLARVAAGLIAVAYLLTLASRAGRGHQTTPAATPSATHATATPTVALPASVPVKTLCQAVPGLVQFTVQDLYRPTRGGGVNVSNSIIVNEPAAAKTLARQLCALPARPPTIASCAGTGGHWTQFIFTSAGNGYWTVWVDRGGCMAVLGVGSQARTTVPDKRLWPTVVADLRDGTPLGSHRVTRLTSPSAGKNR